jgi:cell wall-associated NlpC family hydrolase
MGLNECLILSRKHLPRMSHHPPQPIAFSRESAPDSLLQRLDRRACTGLAVLALLALGGCSSAPVMQDAPSAPTVPARLSAGQSDDVAIYALGLVGTPYRYGGNTPDSGFDCSGLIGHVFQVRTGLAPPRTVARLQSWGQGVAKDQVRTGDLVIFSRRDQAATHAGIYVGADRFVHAPSTGGEVRLDSLSARYWASQQFAFRRP